MNQLRSLHQGPVDCACVIHGKVYGWEYVQRLYNMLNRHITCGIRFHVYTEATRPVPQPMIKHVLPDWQIQGPKQSWWYKLQVFNTQHHQGPLLYFDLDTVILQNIDWIWQSDLHFFWAARDFKYLWRPTSQTVNTSIMWFDTIKFSYVYADAMNQGIKSLMRQHHGDQDYITDKVPQQQRRFLDQNRVQSWRWQALDGGFDFARRTYRNPGSGTNLNNANILVFHGRPKPADTQDPVIAQHWQ